MYFPHCSQKDGLKMPSVTSLSHFRPFGRDVSCSHISLSIKPLPCGPANKSHLLPQCLWLPVCQVTLFQCTHPVPASQKPFFTCLAGELCSLQNSPSLANLPDPMLLPSFSWPVSHVNPQSNLSLSTLCCFTPIILFSTSLKVMQRWKF